MKRRLFLFLFGAGTVLPLKNSMARPNCSKVTLIDAKLELGGAWGGSAPADAAVVIERMRVACLAGIALLSDHQPGELRVDDSSGSVPSIWLHTDNPTTGWIKVIVGTRDWCNLAYQFGHELGHVFCNSWQPDAKPRDPCQWIEESLVEAFSLRGLGILADNWKHAPPFPNDSAYAGSIRNYRETLLAGYRTAAREQDVSTMLDLLQSDAALIADMGALNRWPERSGVPLHSYLDLWERSCAELNAPGRLPVRLRDLLAPT